MVATRYTSNVTKCIRCQSRTLSDFLRLAGLNVHQATRPQPLGGIRQYSRRVPWRIEAANNIAREKGEEGTATVEDEQEEITHEEASSVPWYLRDQKNPKTPALRLEREKLPELPPDSPKNLQPILEHLSTDIGLDYLTLLDMRALDPPSPLGANLIMLIGTARSEKHLHVAAGRFSRWLRKTYKFKVEADGLIGPKELKKRLRRKNKRAKLLSSVQASEQSNRDDGLSNTWICINAGFIEKSKSKEQSLDAKGIVGFGTKVEGTRLVLQMFTEEKREQTDLETLWNSYLTRQDRRDASMAQAPDIRQSDEITYTSEAKLDSGRLKYSQTNVLLSASHTPPLQGFQVSNQVRNFHRIGLRNSEAHRHLGPALQDLEIQTVLSGDNMESSKTADTVEFVAQGSKPNTVGSGKVRRVTSIVRKTESVRPTSESPSPSGASLWASSDLRFRSRQNEAPTDDTKLPVQGSAYWTQNSASTMPDLVTMIREQAANKEIKNHDFNLWRQIRLKRLESNNRAFELLYRLRSLTHEKIRSQLGDGANDRTSTEFLRKFFREVPSPGDTRQWQLLFELLLLGHTVKHPGYNAQDIIHLLERFAGPQDHFSAGTSYTIIAPVIKQIFHWFFSHDSDGELDPLYRRLVNAVATLNQKHLKLFSQAMCEDLYLIAIRVHSRQPGTQKNAPRTNCIWYLSQNLQRQGIHPTDSQVDARVLEALATIKEWDEYWHYWHGIARRLQRRPQCLYALMFEHVAAYGHQRRAIQALEEWIPEMELESPPVHISQDLARAIMLCLQVADPIVVDHVTSGINKQGQWVRLWRRCEEHLESPSEEVLGLPNDLDRIRDLYMSYQEILEEPKRAESESTTGNTPEELLDDL
ncbi:ATPase synthesis protein 25 mitochondrial [Thelotrema lepadinum]|nr:ATPase synthesis protein 25 mitochondrial [Thelotrema lepadinum]